MFTLPNKAPKVAPLQGHLPQFLGRLVCLPRRSTPSIKAASPPLFRA
jgi:hypothetical protein